MHGSAKAFNVWLEGRIITVKKALKDTQWWKCDWGELARWSLFICQHKFANDKPGKMFLRVEFN